MTRVRIPPTLREQANGEREIVAEGDTVRDLLEDLMGRFPALRAQIVEAGELEPGRELLEPTSGNTGISLALVAKLKGYPLTCVMPENATEERKRLLRLFGATIVFSPPTEGSNGAVRLALELAEREPRYFMPFQYANEANPRAHYEGTGAEIVDGLDRVDVLVAR